MAPGKTNDHPLPDGHDPGRRAGRLTSSDSTAGANFAGGSSARSVICQATSRSFGSLPRQGGGGLPRRHARWRSTRKMCAASRRGLTSTSAAGFREYSSGNKQKLGNLARLHAQARPADPRRADPRPRPVETSRSFYATSRRGAPNERRDCLPLISHPLRGRARVCDRVGNPQGQAVSSRWAQLEGPAAHQGPHRVEIEFADDTQVPESAIRFRGRPLRT